MKSKIDTLKSITNSICSIKKNGPILIGIDGVDGSGKTSFAKSLVELLKDADRDVLHTSIDFFHNPSGVRRQKNKELPFSFYEDSFNYDKLKEKLLDPLKYQLKSTIFLKHYDHLLDCELKVNPIEYRDNTILIFDGIFLHRDETLKYWDYSVFLDVSFATSFKRMAKRDGCSPDFLDEKNERYYKGQLIYLDKCNPKSKASIIINNNVFENPQIDYEINKAAKDGYSKSGDTYSSGRPTYPLASIKFLVDTLNIEAESKVLDIAAGTGKLTGELIKYSSQVIALEPVEEMRRKFSELYPNIKILEGRAEELPFKDNFFDVIVVATAFHWFDAKKSYQEIHRVLKPNGRLALIWNSWNKNENPDWLQNIREVIEPYSGKTPRYRDMKWRYPFDSEGMFSKLEFKAIDQSAVVSVNEVVSRMMSISFISALSESEYRKVEDKIRAILKMNGGNIFKMPYECHLYWCSKQV